MGGQLSLWKTELNPDKDLVDLHGKVALITGGNSGIGFRSCQFLARKGAKVYLGARNESKAVAAIAQLEREGLGDGSIHFLKCNLSNLHDAKRCAEQFLNLESRLDILINNAARAADLPFELTTEGLSEHMQTNHIGHFILTDMLLDLLKQTSRLEGADVRIVNLSSLAHTDYPVRQFDRAMFSKRFPANSRNNIRAYGVSKLANILHMRELQRRLLPDYPNITCLSVHPGVVITPHATKFFNNAIPYLGWLTGLIYRTVGLTEIQGAYTPCFAAAGVKVREDREKYRTAYLTWWNIITIPSKEARNDDLAKELWETTEQIILEFRV